MSFVFIDDEGRKGTISTSSHLGNCAAMKAVKKEGNMQSNNGNILF